MNNILDKHLSKFDARLTSLPYHLNSKIFLLSKTIIFPKSWTHLRK